MLIIRLFLLGILAASLIAGEASAEGLVVEQSQPLKGGRGLGTAGYSPTQREAGYFKQITEKPIDLTPDIDMPAPTNVSEAEWAKMKAQMAAERAKLIPVATYTLAGQVGEYVGWFGIVRSITRDEASGRSTLIIQHLYFDGLTDLHLQVVSCNGAGDFTTVVPDMVPGITKLGLVRCYGRVGKGDGVVPQVAPDYIRTWAWGQFTFMDYGLDKSSPAWVKLRKVKPEDFYSSRPDRKFYLDRLGSPE